jgi:hypothetical protein
MKTLSVDNISIPTVLAIFFAVIVVGLYFEQNKQKK